MKKIILSLNKLSKVIDLHEKNGESAPKTKRVTQSSSQIDALIDEENSLQAKSGIVPIGAAVATTKAESNPIKLTESK